MTISDIISFLHIFIGFLFLFIALPFKLLGFKLKDKNLLSKIFASFSIGANAVIIIVYILAGLRLLNRISLILSFLLLILIVILLFYKNKLFALFALVKNTINSEKSLSFSLAKNKFYSFFNLYYTRLKNNPLFFILIAFFLCCGFFIRAYYPLSRLYFAFPDIYSHTDWTAFVLDNQLFADGVYPFGLHNMAAALTLFLNVNLVTTMRFFGVCCGFFILLSLLFLMQKVFKSKLIIAFSLFFYTSLNIFPTAAYARQSSAFPQEAGLIFLFPSAIFFIEYLENSNKKTLIYLVSSLTLTAFCHIYAAFFAALIIAVIALTHFRYLLSIKRLLNLGVAAVICLTVSFSPLAAAIASGTVPQSSFNWALMENQKKEALATDNNKTYTLSDTLEEAADGFMPVNALKYFLILTAFLLVAAILMQFKNKNTHSKTQLSIILFSAALLLIPLLKLDKIVFNIEKVRILSVFALTFSVLAGILLNYLADSLAFFLKRIKLLRFSKEKFIAVFSFICAFILFLIFGFQDLGECIQSQYSSSVQAILDISATYPANTWSLISTDSEISLIRQYAHHYKSSDLIFSVEEKQIITFPEAIIFVLIEKRPLYPNRLYRANKQSFLPEKEISFEAAKTDTKFFKQKIDDTGYDFFVFTSYSNRFILMSKLYYLMQSVISKNSTAISVFFEDSDIIIYRVDQNGGNLVNFAVEY